MIVAVFTGVGYVYAFGVNLYWMDDWDTLPVLFERYDAGALTLADFWELHNEHRLLFPKLVMFGLGLLTRGNAVANMYFSQLLLAAILAMFVMAFRRQFTGGWAMWLMVPMAFFVFSWRQTENMLWGFQVGFVMVMAAALAAFLCLSRLNNQRFGLMFVSALASATVAAFSSIHGLLVWPVGLGQLLIMSLSRRLKVLLAGAWASAGVAEWLVYFHHWVKPSYHPPWAFDWQFLPTLVGGAIWSSPGLALAGGIVLLFLAAAAVVLVFLRRKWAQHSFWLATMAFALATLGAITIGRCGLGLDKALASRYATVSIPLVIASYVICATENREKRHPVPIALAALLLMLAVAGAALSVPYGLALGRSGREFGEYQQFVVATIDQQPSEIVYQANLFLADGAALVQHAAAVLKKLKYNVFADAELCARYALPDPAARVLAAATRYGIDNIAAVPEQGAVLIRGWAIDSVADDVAGAVAVVLDGVVYPTYYGRPNQGAVKTMQRDKFLLSGFECRAPPGRLGKGEHQIVLKIQTHDHQAVFNTPQVHQFSVQ